MSLDSTNRQLLAAWQAGDEQAATLLFERFQTRLFALVRSRISRQLARRVDPDDIVLSAYRSFFVAARNGRVQPTESDDLWPLLVTMTLRKLARQARRHSSMSRSMDREDVDESAWLHAAISLDPSPEQVALLSDELQSLCRRLDSTDQEVLTQTLQGSDPTTIAASLGVKERTIRRSLERIRLEAARGQPDLCPLSGLAFPRQATVAWSPTSRPSSSDATISYEQLLLQQLVGAGAFSKVYKALDRRTGDIVAVKFLRRDCWNDVRAAAAIIREWEALRQVDHPNILRVRDWGQTKRGALFLVSDFIPGTDLETWRQTHEPTICQIIRSITVVAHAISAAHQVGVLHCDLKPSNILRNDDGHLFVCDFGLSRWKHDPDDVPRGGTAGFLCPEQVSGAFGSITERSDVYGLGGLLYSLLTGQPPMTGRDLPETLANVLSLASPRPPSQLRSGISADFDAIVLKCLRKEPGERYGSVLELATDIGTEL